MNKLKQMETALSPGGGQQAVDQMDNQTLLLRYKEAGDMELKWALVLRYTDLVRRIAIQTCGLFSGFTQLDDVIHEGILVLLSAVDKYDPEKEVKFEAYIAKRLRGNGDRPGTQAGLDSAEGPAEGHPAEAGG